MMKIFGPLKNREKIAIFNADNIHGDYYCYGPYKSSHEKWSIYCPVHGKFEQPYHAHVDAKQGCPECAKETRNIFQIDKKNKAKNKFFKDMMVLHPTLDFSEFNYGKDNKSKGTVRCKKCNEYFEKSPNALSSHRQGCPNHKNSKGELAIVNWLKTQGFIQDKDFILQKKFKDCRDKRPLAFDVYLSQYNLCIEFDGEQHFRIIRNFGNKVLTEHEASVAFERIKKHDKIKTDYCKNNNILLFRIKYTELRNIDKTLNNYFKYYIVQRNKCKVL